MTQYLGDFLARCTQKTQWRDSIANLSDELDEALTKHLEAELERSVGKAVRSVEVPATKLRPCRTIVAYTACQR